MRHVIGVSDIQNFRPADTSDFDNKSIYDAFWREGVEDNTGFYSAQVLALGTGGWEEPVYRERSKVTRQGEFSRAEIIEFPVLKVNGRSFQVESTFHQYVQPRVHRELSSFCTELVVNQLPFVYFQLTGIIQDMVDEQPFLEEVLEKFHQWMCSEGLLGSPEKRAAFVTFGDWDLQKMLPSQCSYFKIPVPEYLTSWINLKK
ncbi:hypothetical protein HPB47_015743, partial [Ixodes persulcatus]